ncbi:MAG: cupin domain-containing protein [Lachnospiraceae bacterium]|nr:cupin domain-containing protein [Lachnospiraceae bacterium]
MNIIRNCEIEEGLRETGRVYLCGNLEKSNAVRHIPTERYEIGISDYPVYTFEKAHVHLFNTEFNFVLEGAVKIFLPDKKQEFLFCKGDLYVIEPGEPYVGKCLAGTRTVFSKVPGGNDKLLVEMSPSLMQWGSSWESSYGEEAE